MARGRSKTEAPAALKLKTCTRKIRQGSNRVQCGKQYLGDERNCPNSNLHVLTVKSGFCANGNCEGTNQKSPSGKPMKTCEFFNTCGCECHDQISKLFELTGNERILVDSSGYIPDFGEFIMPELLDGDPLSMSDTGNAPRMHEDAPSAPVPPPVARSYEPTPTGRTARGQLESWVLRQVTIWTVEKFDFYCTPVWISKNIAHDEAVPPPSVGAIGAVFDRWVKLGFAVIEKKPVRFVQFTDEGKRLGLEKMKASIKRSERLRKAEIKRGSLR